ncbi:MAG TPA: hypothetical protein VGL09_12005 [Methylomirabilota bacterium]
MIEWLGVGVKSTDGAWLVRGVSARLSFPELTAVVSADAQARRAVLDAAAGRLFPQEGRVWVGGVPVMPDTRRRVQSLLADIDLDERPDPRRSLYDGVRAAVLRVLGHVGLDREDTAAALPDGARARLARGLVPRPDHIVVREVDAARAENEAAEFLAALRRVVRAERVAAVFTCRSLALAHEHADRLLVLGDGRVVLDGVPGGAAEDDGDRAAVALARER